MSEEPIAPESRSSGRTPEKRRLEAAERAAISTARATWAIAALTLATMVVGLFQYITFGRQLAVMRGQLESMLRDERPRLRILTEIMPAPSFDLLSGSQDTGYIFWNVPYFNAGKATAQEVTIDTYMSLDDHPFLRSYNEKRMEPLHIEEILPGGSGFLTIFSSPIPKTQFDTLKSKQNGISIYLDFSFRDEMDHRSHLTTCFLLTPNGAIGNVNAGDCKKKITG